MTTPKERALLVGLDIKGSRSLLTIEDSVEELARLSETAGLIVVGQNIQRLNHPYPSTYVGPGKLEELKIQLDTFEAGVVVFDDELLPRQQRELEKYFGEDVKVLDRTALILDIFAQHANTSEGKLQVELAQLEYRLPRLTRMWTHLARQAGGRVGGASGGVGLRGPGETQLETDRREIGRRITHIKNRLDSVRSRREQHRSKRQQTELRVVAIVGYTNAGKSTLLNKISGSNILSEDKLFATLDPTTRKVIMPGGQEVLLTDTVGFIQKLPTEIVQAFRATLEEIADADVLLHVVDISHPNVLAQIDAVKDTLAELEVEHLPTIVALNKIDLLSRDEIETVVGKIITISPTVLISAFNGEGIEDLLGALEASMVQYLEPVHLMIPYKRGDLISLLHERGQVDQETHKNEGVEIFGRVPGRLKPYFEQYHIEQ